jgi:hypothetical protein
MNYSKAFKIRVFAKEEERDFCEVALPISMSAMHVCATDNISVPPNADA